jgi:arylsulfatase A-like enzyme
MNCSRQANLSLHLLHTITTLAIFLASGYTINLSHCTAYFAENATRPNVVLIMTDDLGYGDLGCYNADSKIPTPRIDRLASEGLRFTDAHSPSSVCSPTRYGLLTGRYAWRTRMKSGVLNGYSAALLEPDRWTLASLLQAHGYRTACIGKWHLGLGTREPADYAQPFKPGPREAGFDESFVLPASLDMPPYVFVENGQATTFPSGHVGDSKMRRYDGEGYWRAGAIAPGFRHVDTLPTVTDKAVAFLERQAPERPFLLYVPLAAPHTPWMPTDEFRGRTQVGYYGDFLAQVDTAVGRLLDALRTRGLADQTLVIFTSDNGAHWLPADIEKYGHRSNAPWRGMKADLYEGGHRVPMIVRWPGVVAAGSRTEQLVCLTDWMATLAEIVGQSLPAEAGPDSYSFLATLQGRMPPVPREAIVHHSSDGTFAIRRGPWKLATKLGSHGFSAPKHEEPQPGGPRGQLYNLAADPGETNNRWLDEPGVVRQLTQLLDQYQTHDRSSPRN